MKILALSLTVMSALVMSCATSATSASSALAYPMYNAKRTLTNSFPPSHEYSGQVDASVRQLFATLPYFKGETYSERYEVVSAGRAVKGSLKKHYFKAAGTPAAPEQYYFPENGYGHEMLITRGTSTTMADYMIKIRDKAAGVEILKMYAVFATNYGGVAAPSSQHQWFILSGPITPATPAAPVVPAAPQIQYTMR